MLKKKLLDWYSFAFGVEVETNINDFCEHCNQCRVCEDCPACQYCDVCVNCEYEEIYNYILENNLAGDIVKSAKYLDSSLVCRICQREQIYREFQCQRCNVCEGCEYVYNSAYCPRDDYEIEFPAEIAKYVKDQYEDPSCGLEIVSEVFTDLFELRKFLRGVVEVIGEDKMSPESQCGGHFNISWRGWEEDFEVVYHNAAYFLDLLSYMFNEEETHNRDGWKYYPINLMSTDDKYSAIHEKSYCVEFRFPDSPRDVDNYILMAATIMAICTIPFKIAYDKDERLKTRSIYDKIHETGDKLSRDDKRYLEEKFKLLMRLTRRFLKELEEKYGVSFERALHWRFKYPKYEESRHNKRIDLDEFRVVRKVECAQVVTLENFGIVVTA